jgi:hypothetical protein
MTTAISHEAISDWSGCPHCVAEGKAGYATVYFNANGALWGICDVHLVRWYVTRELLGTIEEDPGALQQYVEVEGVHRMGLMTP